jgi:hypothetical protein
MLLVLSTCFHADAVVSLARSLGVGLKARLLVVTAVLDTAIRSCRLCDAKRTHARKHHEQNDYSFHDDFSFLVFTRCVLALYARCFVDCCTQSESELFRVVVRPKMHKEQPWLLVQHVAMNGRHLDAI